MNTSRGSASIESHDESASYKRAKDSTPAQTGPGALTGFGLAAQERAAPGIGGGVRALCRKPEEAGSGRDGAGSEKEALLVPMLALDPGSQPAEPAGAHPVPRASFRDSALLFPPGGCALATTLHSPQGTCRLPLAPFLGAQREGWEAHRGCPRPHRELTWTGASARVCDASWLMAALPSQVPDSDPDGESLEERVPACLPRPADQRRRQGAGPCSEPHRCRPARVSRGWEGSREPHVLLCSE